MPTYEVKAIQGRFSATQKSRLAGIITEIHSQATGAPAYLAQVIFQDVTPGNYFVGGKLLGFDNIFIHGHIRAGHSAEVKERLILELMHSAALIAETDRSCVQVYLSELPARSIAEWGQILPKPGEEAAWAASVPDAVRERMKSLLS